MSGTSKPQRIWNALFINVCMVNFCQQTGHMMMNTLVPKYASSLGAAAATVGMVSSMFAVTALAIRPVASPAFDSLSKRRLLMAAQLLIVGAFLCYSFAQSIPTLIAARLLHGIGSGCTAPLCLALASNSLPDESMSQGVGVYSLGQALAQALGPSLGLTLSARIGYGGAFKVGALMVIFAFVLSFFLKEPPRDPTIKYQISFDRVVALGALRPVVLLALLQTGYVCISAFLAIYGGLRGVESIGLYFTAYALSLFVCRPICGKLADRYGFEKVVAPGILCFALSFVLISRADSLPLFLLAGVASAFGYGVSQPTLQSLCLRCVPKSRRGAASNTSYIGMDCGMLAGPIIGGLIVDRTLAITGDEVGAYSFMYLSLILVNGLALLFLLLGAKKIRRQIALANAQNALPG